MALMEIGLHKFATIKNQQERPQKVVYNVEHKKPDAYYKVISLH
jgi:hypothetical protein